MRSPFAAGRLARASVLVPVVLAALLACPRREPGELAPGDPGEGARDGDRGVDTTTPADTREALEPFAAPRECESLCGLVHDCLLAESPPPGFPELAPRQAASLELDCLGYCIAGGGSLGASRFASCDASSTCAELLPCVRASWPAQAIEPEPELTPTPSSSGCRQGCQRLGECFDAAQTLVDDCAQGCEDKLGPEDEIAFGECTRSSDCLLMLECMQKFPGSVNARN